MAQAIKGFLAANNDPDRTKFEDWLDGYTELFPEDAVHLEKKFGPGDYPDRWVFEIRLPDDVTLSNVIDELSEDVFAGFKWYALFAHDCEHGRDNSRVCSGWGAPIRERGNVPEVYRDGSN
jgi:hypothetical protein